MELKPIGIVVSRYRERADAPRQGRESEVTSRITIFEDYQEGLDGLENYSNIIVLYWADRADRNILRVVPPGQTQERGVFATRSPSRPNPIAMCMVDLLEIKGKIITVRGLDALDGSPVLDIKPFSSEIDSI
ncbi:tRNA (N6-threonylcarbamoyladenosine(37)-N6)-methyltransferase TrmO [Methanobacterium aggregans]|uniref:tRNA (N6-threonylcarbamoyladenosine(37)-N6)-methyltransferase TrmO n=1 Tax=Methanobacterium aggregans TaxID=1615586 RepID=UPI001AE11DAD|nr:tRNA (N6-threonylcarbamoyladenosine(37)-N6)-methyltransferase TrmO [Methanobacterium aggregans]MBP2046703.1 tRNA-Thr(GGU) m(6)t(6)A37 methyltransferase TsaA [Methanobacterium aggregans]